jgi:predicted nucleic acid-binding protein
LGREERSAGAGTSYMSAEVRGAQRHFVDTNIFVYAHDESARRKGEVARALIGGLWESRVGCASVQVMQELFVNLTRKVPKPLTVRDAAALIEDLSAWTVHSPGVRDVLSAIELYERMGVSFWDAMILTSARSLGCRVLYSEDLSAGQSYDGVLVVNPFDASL